ncbi:MULTISPECIES: AAA family ATPase [Cyanophyceae]|uniref:AAA family ATPase n=1 Tax=Cyanophyceae TaxID=3028117 RepID=UPI001687398F|nr:MULTISPECIES: AAA family ATPase [unclassified Phormidium]MBD1917266.1 ParA family protein [Phormidium sp. FACHB-77]MBD2028482.1 ParA family protein [Phormidium sp. FACHB-322]MBD2049663.1 ParA family protein [Leptolyngbya sp. FACHB-60]
MKICSAISLSGGQGKTTTAFFTALLLAQQGKKVLAVDADPQANLTFYLGHEVQPDEPSLFEVLTKQVEVEDGVYGTQYENLFVMPADRGLFKVSDFLSSSGAGAFILKQRLRKIHDMFDVVLIDVQPSRSQICLSAVGASDHVLIPVEANVKGVNSLVDTLDFLNEQAELEAFTGSVLGIIPFRDRWVGNTQTLEGRQNIAAMKEFAGEVPILASIRESEKFKNAIRQGKLLSELDQPDLQYPFEQIVEALTHE